MGGSTEADLNVTYNDSEHFPFRDMHGKKVSETILELEDAEKQLGTELHPDYWEPTEGNAGHAWNILAFPSYAFILYSGHVPLTTP